MQEKYEAKGFEPKHTNTLCLNGMSHCDVTHVLKDPRPYLVFHCNWSEYEGKA